MKNRIMLFFVALIPLSVEAKQTARVIFDKQGGSGGSYRATVEFTKGEPFWNSLWFESFDIPSRTGYVFGGYYSSPNGEGDIYFDSKGNGDRWTWYNYHWPMNVGSFDVKAYAYWISDNSGSGTTYVPPEPRSEWRQLTWKDSDTGYEWLYYASGIRNSSYWTADGKASLCNTNGSVAILPRPTGAVTIPTSFPDNVKVTSIGYEAFVDCKGLTSIVIPDSVTSIGRWAFAGCSGLTSVTIPDSVTSIDWWAFSGCSGLTSVTIPDSVTKLGDNAFYECTGLTSITLFTNPGRDSFAYCRSLKDVTLCNGVHGIASGAFRCCTRLTSVTIPGSVTSIGDSAFYGCSELTNMTMPGSVTSIGSSAFYGCRGLTSVTIPGSVTSIGDSAFYGCSGLTSAVICNGVTEIDPSSFYGCTSLTSVRIPSCVTNIENHAFYDCSNLTTIYVSQGDVNRVSELMTNSGFDITNVNFIETKESSVILDQQGGNGGWTSMTVAHGFAMPPIMLPTRSGYAFGGYWTGANGGGTQYYTMFGASARNWDGTSATTLYAKWVPPSAVKPTLARRPPVRLKFTRESHSAGQESGRAAAETFRSKRYELLWVFSSSHS